MKWYTKTVSVDEIETSVIEIQRPLVSVKHGQIEYILKKSDGKFLIVWCENKDTEADLRTVYIRTQTDIEKIEDLN
jgi:hypothetical protein